MKQGVTVLHAAYHVRDDVKAPRHQGIEAIPNHHTCLSLLLGKIQHDSEVQDAFLILQLINSSLAIEVTEELSRISKPHRLPEGPPPPKTVRTELSV